VQRLTFKGFNNTSPAWSPDGRQIAYVGIKDNRIDIFILNIEKGMPVQLTMNAGDNEDPSWSSDGSLMAFTSTRDGGVPKLFIMNASGSDQRKLLSLKGRQTQPAWSISTGTDN
jgi:TolB protein